MIRAGRWAAGLLIGGVVVCSCAGGDLFVLQVPFVLAVGWVEYLATVLPRVRVNVAGVGLFVVALPIAAWLAHSSASWLYGAGRRWRWKWTLLGLAVVMLMFIAGLAATSVVHQTGWLLRSPEPLVISSWRARFDTEVARCETNVRQIGAAISAYAAANDGHVPADRADLVHIVAAEGGQPEWFVCDDPDYGFARPATREAGWIDRVATGKRHFTYHYFATPVPGPDGKRRVRLCDREIHYYGGFLGMVLLYEDGTVETLDRAGVQRWLGEEVGTSPDWERLPPRVEPLGTPGR